MHRIASSERYSSSLKEIEWGWTIDDVWDANVILNLYAKAEADALKEAKR